MGNANASANAYDGKIINDPFELLEFVNWLRRSTRDTACVLLSQDARGNPHVPLDQVRKTVGSRAVTVLLDNAMQRSARNQLGILNPHHGAARVFPSGDAWCDDSSLVYCVLPALPTNPLAVFNGLRQHQLRAGRGGDNPGRKDAHGNTIYRCNVHGQYRLHFTRDGAERVTFLSVNTHGDLLL